MVAVAGSLTPLSAEHSVYFGDSSEIYVSQNEV